MRQITFEGLMTKLAVMPKVVDAEIKIALTKAAVQVQKTAVQKFGSYQPQYGPFQAWAALSSSTLRQKLRAGGTGDDPLIGHYVGRAGNKVYPTSLRQSITMDVRGLTAVVGTNNPLGKYHEYGTAHIPPRPFLRPALYQNEDWIKKSMKEAMGMGLVTFLKQGV